MPTISRNQKVATLIDVFTVAPERQQALIELLARAVEEVMRGLPGFISASIHGSLDGTRVVDYIQFESIEAFEAMVANPRMQSYIAQALAMAPAEAKLYEVARVIE